MRIAYVAYWHMSSDSGVTKKIRGQLQEWRRHGHEAELFFVRRGTATRASVDTREHEFDFHSGRARLAQTLALIGAVERFAPDVIYLRYDIWFMAIRRLRRLGLCILEINENRTEVVARGRMHSVVDYVNRAVVLRLVHGVAAVTHELGSEVSVRFPRLPVAVIANGGPASLSPAVAPANSRPQIVFLGGGYPWHGVDKIASLAARRLAWDFHVVGLDPGALTGTANVTSYGLLNDDEYGPLLDAADIAIGSLAMHRIQMKEASPLKVREYLLAGIPTIIGYSDTDFADREPWFLLRLPNCESNVETGEADIAAFVDRVRGRRIERHEVSCLTLAAKEAERLAFLERLRATGSGRRVLHRRKRTARNREPAAPR